MKEVVKREGCCLKTYIHLCLFLWEKKGFSLSLVPSIGLFGDFHLFQAGVGPSGHLYFQNNIKVCGSTCQFFVNFLLIFLGPLSSSTPYPWPEEEMTQDPVGGCWWWKFRNNHSFKQVHLLHPLNAIYSLIASHFPPILPLKMTLLSLTALYYLDGSGPVPHFD